MTDAGTEASSGLGTGADGQGQSQNASQLQQQRAVLASLAVDPGTVSVKAFAHGSFSDNRPKDMSQTEHAGPNQTLSSACQCNAAASRSSVYAGFVLPSCVAYVGSNASTHARTNSSRFTHSTDRETLSVCSSVIVWICMYSQTPSPLCRAPSTDTILQPADC